MDRLVQKDHLIVLPASVAACRPMSATGFNPFLFFWIGIKIKPANLRLTIYASILRGCLKTYFDAPYKRHWRVVVVKAVLKRGFNEA
ncbi:hypothetical protein [Niabella aurantiaca]|uniref:hypothetical protein n=1 Tax=Niabella aurantiaca TaxID=379900 RepID=UPI0012FC5807|nr:hypothetical protein [Niabella aurantiaca]